MRFFCYVFVLFSALSFSAQAQTKITDGGSPLPDPNAILELESTNKGFVPPRLSLTATNNPAPLTTPLKAGTLVYNLASTGTSWIGIGN